MRDITKTFFGVTVLDHVNLTVAHGEVHALLGENGAGKSTLLNILAGVHPKDSGTVEFFGDVMEHTTVKSAEAAGIAFVHQELNLFNDLKVYENLYLGKEITGFAGALNKTRMRAEARDLFERMGVDIDPDALVSELETSRRQLLEIAKALHAHAKLLILDEPTTALNTSEIDHLFTLVRALRAEGTSFIFTSHKMKEIFEISDRYTVLRNGRNAGAGVITDITPTEMTKLMVGSSYSDRDVYAERDLGDTVLELRDFSGKGFSGVNLAVKRGEVVGLTGLKSAGVSELLQTIFGVMPATGGELYIDGQPVKAQGIHNAMRHKVAMIASDRKENSVIPDCTLAENFFVSEHRLSSRQPVISGKREARRYGTYKTMLNIKAESARDLITSLSGGNQQKVVLARWLNTDAEILLMDNPTQGIDVGAKAEIYRLIIELASQGKTILVNTLEIPEIQRIVDRCIVFYHGRASTEILRRDLTEERVMLYATGAVEGAPKTTPDTGNGDHHGH